MFHCLRCWDAPSFCPTLVFSQFQVLLSHLLRAMGAGAGPSMVCTLPSASGVVSGPSKVCTLPDTSDVCPEVCTLPSALDLGSMPPIPPWVERRLELLLQENSPNCPQVSFFFFFFFEKILLLNPDAPYKEGPVLSHSPPLQLERGPSRSGPDMAQLSTLPSLCPQSLWDYHFILIPLPATSSNQVSLSAAQTLFGRGGSH